MLQLKRRHRQQFPRPPILNHLWVLQWHHQNLPWRPHKRNSRRNAMEFQVGKMWRSTRREEDERSCTGETHRKEDENMTLLWERMVQGPQYPWLYLVHELPNLTPKLDRLWGLMRTSRCQKPHNHYSIGDSTEIIWFDGWNSINTCKCEGSIN